MNLRLNVLFAVMAALAIGCSDDEGDGNPVDNGTTTSFTVSIENVAVAQLFSASGVFNTPAGAPEPGPLTPGNQYQFTFGALPGAKLSFATMMIPSNDLFFGPGPEGIALFDGAGIAISGDITDQIDLWDGGTEANEEPGSGPNQPMRGGGDSGPADPTNSVRLATDDFGNLPAVNDVIRVTILPIGPNLFTVTIENISNANTLATEDGSTQAVPLAPGAWVVHTENAPYFSEGQPDRGEGLEALAEDGDPSILADYFSSETSLNSPLAPGVFAVYTGDNPLFTEGQSDRGQGLEGLAEDGDPGPLSTSLSGLQDVASSGVFNTPVGATDPGPLTSGGSYEFTFDAEVGDVLTLATMLVQTNDLFFAPDQNGIDLFDDNSNPISGDITAQFLLWDAGTEVNQFPGVGPDQAPRQAGPNTGPVEGGTVRLVDDGFPYPATADAIRVTITVN